MVAHEAVQFWTTIPGGQLTQDEAQAKWDQMVANKDKLGIICDAKGPSDRHRLRMRVHTADFVDFESAGIRAKEVAFAP